MKTSGILITIFMLLFCAPPVSGQVTEDDKLVADIPVYNDQFGYSVSISGDHAIVGAHHHDGVGNDSGAAYIYRRDQQNPDVWNQVVKLVPSIPAANDHFGISVSISGDYALVGANQDDDTYSNSGSAYLFYRHEGGTDKWGQIKKLTASDPGATDNFGETVSLSGDYAIVGAPRKDDNGMSSGSAYVFYRNQGTTDSWAEQAKLTALDAYERDYFGISVSISGDYALVGAWGNDDDSTDSGSAYVFHRNEIRAVTWDEQAKLLAYDREANDYFGDSVSIFGDYALVGAYGEDEQGSNAGAAYIFYRNQGSSDNWGGQGKLKATGGNTEDRFGTSVAMSADYALVGAYGFTAEDTDSGAAFTFSNDGLGNWTQSAKLYASDGAEDDYFGFAVAASGDTALVGAYEDDDTHDESGSAYIFDMGSTLVTLVAFDATGRPGGIELCWKTESEINNAGFHVWRSDGKFGPYRQITSHLIPGRGGSSWGADYRYRDTDVVPGTTYHYKLEDIEYSGRSYLHGPAPTVWKDSLLADVDELSMSTGGVIGFSLRAGVANAGREYALLGSLSGTSPGTLLPGELAVLPLNVDLFTRMLVRQADSPWCRGFTGILDHDGNGSAELIIPPAPSLAGEVFTFAYALRHPFDFVSVPVEVIALP